MPSVKTFKSEKTGYFNVSTRLSPEMIANGKLDVIPHIWLELHYRMGNQIMKILSDKRSYVINIQTCDYPSQDGIDDNGRAWYRPYFMHVYEIGAWILLQHPEDAQVGEFVFHDGMRGISDKLMATNGHEFWDRGLAWERVR